MRFVYEQGVILEAENLLTLKRTLSLLLITILISCMDEKYHVRSTGIKTSQILEVLFANFSRTSTQSWVTAQPTTYN